MVPVFNVCLQEKNKILITDKTQDLKDEYTPEELEFHTFRHFKYSETNTINIIERVPVDKEPVIISSDIFNHCSHLDEFHSSLPEDGYYLITHVILPNKTAIDNLEQDEINLYVGGVYFIDNENLYKRINGIDELIELSALTHVQECNSTISRTYKKIFSTSKLKECFVNICKNIFNMNTSKCAKRDSSLEFNRDFIWMTLNVIKYYLSLGDFENAEIILEDVNYCNGFCNNSTLKILSNDCGCNK